jgi:hypothetical protein
LAEISKANNQDLNKMEAYCCHHLSMSSKISNHTRNYTITFFQELKLNLIINDFHSIMEVKRMLIFEKQEYKNRKYEKENERRLE